MNLRARSLRELSEDLARFDERMTGTFRCPVCLKEILLERNELSHDDDVVSEEHIIPISVGGKITSFLCTTCNSRFGQQQTRWLSEYIAIREGGGLFHPDPRRQRASASANGYKISGALRRGPAGAIEFIADQKRSSPQDYRAFRQCPIETLTISHRMEVFANEHSLNVGFLTAAYVIWFKSFGYSWVLQGSLGDVRRQICNPRETILPWNFLMEARYPSRDPSVGLAKFGNEFFPVAFIYDHIVVLPNPRLAHPPTTPANEIKVGVFEIAPSIHERYQHRCIGPAELVCDGQSTINPGVSERSTATTVKIDVVCWQ